MPDTNPPPRDFEALIRLFKASADKVALGRPYREVLLGWGEFGELQERDHAECRGAGMYPWGLEDGCPSLHYRTGTPTFAPNGVIESSAPSDLILDLHLEVIGDFVTLSDVERVFGAWYRDPPLGKVSYAAAYFNAAAICPGADFFLHAVSNPYADSLTPQSPVHGLVLCRGDDRHEKNTPW